MDSNKKKNSVRYKCQVRDINKKSVSNTRFNLTLLLFYGTIKRRGACFRANFALRFAATKTQMQVKRKLNGRCASVQRGGGTSACCPAHSAVQHAN